MSWLKMVFLLLLMNLSSIQCTNFQKVEVPKNQMHKLAGSMSTLLPLTMSSQAFDVAQSGGVVQLQLRQMINVAEELESHYSEGCVNPIFSFNRHMFSADINLAYQRLVAGRVDSARQLIQNRILYFINCYTTGHRDRGLAWSWALKAKALQPIDRGPYLVAVRDFDKAFEVYEDLLSYAGGLESSKMSLATAIRVKNDPLLALETVKKWFKTHRQQKTSPMGMIMAKWKKSILDWQKELIVNVPRRYSTLQSLQRAQQLLHQGVQAELTQGNEAGLIEFLRASYLLREVLERDLLNLSPRVLYYAGIVEEHLKDINMWTLHQELYEACVRRAARTALGEKCYLKYETAVLTDGIYRSQGFEAPLHIRQHLDILRKTSKVGEWKELLTFLSPYVNE